IRYTVLLVFFLEIPGFGKVVQFFADGVGGFVEFLGQPPHVATVGSIDEKLYQQPQTGFRRNERIEHVRISSNKSTLFFGGCKGGKALMREVAFCEVAVSRFRKGAVLQLRCFAISRYSKLFA